MRIMPKRSVLIAAATVLLLQTPFTTAHAHHSFAKYDIENSIEITGKLTKFAFMQPHINLVLEVASENGEKEFWLIESMSPRRWRSLGLDENFVAVGDEITILGWPSRNDENSMALGTITGDKGRMVVRERIRQRRANDATADNNTGQNKEDRMRNRNRGRK